MADLEFEIVTKADSRGLHETADDMDRAGKSSDHMGSEFKAAAKDSRTLDQEILDLRTHIRELGKQYDDTADKSIFKDIAADRTAIRRIEAIKKDLEQPAPAGGGFLAGVAGDAKSLEKILTDLEAKRRNLIKGTADLSDKAFTDERKRLTSQISLIKQFMSELEAGAPSTGPLGGASLNTELLGSLQGALIPALVGVAVLAAPAIGAIVSGAVAGIGVAGGIAGGVLAATHDPRVKAAFTDVFSGIKGDFFGAGVAFVRPVIDSLHILGKDVDKLDLAGTFAKVAPFVTELATGIGGLVTNLWPGFNALLDKSGPIVDALASGLEGTGAAIGSLLTDIANGNGTVEGITATFIILNSTIQDTGVALKYLGDAFDFSAKAVNPFASAVAKIFGWVPILGGLARSQRDYSQSIIDSGSGVKKVLFDVRKNQDDVTNSMNNGVTAASQEVATFARFADEVRGLNDALDKLLSTELALDDANLAVTQGFADFAKTLKQNGDAWDTNTQKGRDNTKGLLDQIALLQRQRDAAVAAGDGSAKATEDAWKQYDLAVDKLLAMAKQAGATKTELDKLKGKYEVNFVLLLSDINNVVLTAGAAFQGFFKAAHRASGGPVMPGMPYEINEQAHETVTFGQPGVVHPASLTPAWGGARQQSAGPTYISFPSSGVALVDAIVAEMRKYIRINGGGNVQLALGS